MRQYNSSPPVSLSRLPRGRQWHEKYALRVFLRLSTAVIAAARALSLDDSIQKPFTTDAPFCNPHRIASHSHELCRYDSPCRSVSFYSEGRLQGRLASDNARRRPSVTHFFKLVKLITEQTSASSSPLSFAPSTVHDLIDSDDEAGRSVGWSVGRSS